VEGKNMLFSAIDDETRGTMGLSASPLPPVSSVAGC